MKARGLWAGALAILLVVGAVVGLATRRSPVPAAVEIEADAPPANSQTSTAIPPPLVEPVAPPVQANAPREDAMAERPVTREPGEGVALARRSLGAARPRLVDRALARVPARAAEDVAPIGTRAQDQFELALYDDALRLARQAARLAPGEAKYQVLVGDAAFKLGLNADAAAAYARAGMLRPGDPAIRARLDRLLSAVRPPTSAEAPRPRAPSIETTNPYAPDLQ